MKKAKLLKYYACCASLGLTITTVTAQTAAVPATNSVEKPIAPVGTIAPPSPTTQEMAPIYVTGSAIPTTDNESSAPVVIVDSATIEKRGYQTVEDIIRNSPANGAQGDPGQTSNNFAAGASYASLRGLGPQATLVLINGRRVANYAAAANGQVGFVDLNSVPAQLVDRVEVLTDGSAIYGSDAVAGVINIITKKNLGDEDGEVDAYIGNTDSYDAFEQRYTVLGNLSSFDKNGYGVVGIDYEHQNSIMATDRQVSATANQTANGGFDQRSGRTYPGIFQGETSGNVFSILPGQGNTPLNGTTSATDPNVDDGADALQGYDYNKDTTLVPDTTHYGAYMDYTYKFYDGDVTPNVDFQYRHNRTLLQSAPGGYSFFDGDTGPAAANLGGGPAGNPNGNFGFGVPVFTVPTTNPYNNTGEVIDVLSYRNVPLGPRVEDVNSDVFRVVPSIDLKLGEGWTLNVGFNYSYTFLYDKDLNFPSATGFQNALNGTTLATAFNPFTSESSQSQNVLNEIMATSYNRDTSSPIAEDFRLNGKLFDLPAGPVQMAFGGEYRLERYTTNYAEDDLDGNVLSSSIQLDTAASQKDLSGYTEVSIPVTSPSFNVPGVYKFDVDVAGRVDKYSQFGSTKNPQIHFRWEIVPGLVARGGFSTEFRAPSLNELAAGGNQSFTSVFDPVTGTAPQVLVNSPGNADLKPETATTLSAGIAYSPEFIKGLEVSVDYYHIRYENQISQTNAQDLIDADSPLVIRNGAGTITSVTATYENLPGATETDGLDFGLNYVYGDPGVSWGQLTLAVNSTLTLSYLTPGNDPGTGESIQVENLGTDYGGFGPISRYKQDASLTWDFRNFEFVVSNDYQSGYFDTYGLNADFTPVNRRVAAYTTFNLQSSYTFDKQDMAKWAPMTKGDEFDWRTIVAGTRIAVGVNNVWDTQPPFTASEFDPTGYSAEYADPTGRFVYAQISKKF